MVDKFGIIFLRNLNALAKQIVKRTINVDRALVPLEGNDTTTPNTPRTPPILMDACGAASKGTEQYDISEDGDVQKEHADDTLTHKLYFSDLDGFDMMSSFVVDNAITCMKDH